jgi:tellurite resistance protein TerC
MPGSETWTDWAIFAGAVALTILLDRFLSSRSATAVSFREASARSVLTIVAALAFFGFVYFRMGQDKAVSYLVAYLVEESLSVDNLFVFLVIFSYFGVRERYQQRILVWGVLGAIVMRGLFIVAGSALLHRFGWLMYVFGLFLVFTGIKLAFKKGESSVEPESNLALRIARRYLRTTDKLDGDKFFTVKNGVRYATPLLLVLIVIEFTDLLFAVDSVPAVLAVSDDVFVIYTSNIFAILGLRALYFLLAGMMSRFHYLGLGLAAILCFIGVKMFIATWVHVPNLLSLGVIAGVLSIAVTGSLLRPPKQDPEAEPASGAPHGSG